MRTDWASCGPGCLNFTHVTFANLVIPTGQNNTKVVYQFDLETIRQGAIDGL